MEIRTIPAEPMYQLTLDLEELRTLMIAIGATSANLRDEKRLNRGWPREIDGQGAQMYYELHLTSCLLSEKEKE